MKTYLVTGGCGFIGSNFINHVLQNDDDLFIINIDCLNYCGSKTNIDPSFRENDKRYRFVEGNITDKELVTQLLETYHVNTIVHFAAQSHVDHSFDNSLQYTMDNVYGTHVLLQCAKEYGKLDLFLHFSTDEVYGEVDIDHEGCNEKSLLNPTNPYAATKAAAEFIVRSYYHSFKLPTVIVRCNNVYGPNQYPEKLIPKFIHLLKTGHKLTIHGKGDTRRNFIWAEDVAKATKVVIAHAEHNQIYNIGSTQEYSVMDIAAILVKQIKHTEKIDDYIEYVTDRPFNDFRYSVTCDKLLALGWKIEHTDFEQNIAALL
jgi:dTDP-glucose 4,6-dehydratase